MDRSAEEILAWLGERADEMAELVEALVRIPTENPPGRELGRCAAVLRDALDGLGPAPEPIELKAALSGDHRAHDLPLAARGPGAQPR